MVTVSDHNFNVRRQHIIHHYGKDNFIVITILAGVQSVLIIARRLRNSNLKTRLVI